MQMLPSFLSRTKPKSWKGCEPPTPEERLAEFKFKWYANGYHHQHENNDNLNDFSKDNA